MKIITVDNYQELSLLGAEILRDIIKSNPTATLGLATGSTVLGMYAHLCKMYSDGEISFKTIKTVNLDEYIGLDESNVQSYAYFMRENLFKHTDINKANTFIPNGVATDLTEECKRYDSLLDNLPRDVQLLGLGSDGHIAFNEPGSPFDSRTRVVKLEDSTIRDNSRLFSRVEDVPKSAVTVGIADIMSAKQLLLLASGLNKAQAVKAMIKGKISVDCPASILQRHPNVIVVLDKLAASQLTVKDTI